MKYEISKSECGCYYYIFNTVTLEQVCDYIGTPLHFKTFADAQAYVDELEA